VRVYLPSDGSPGLGKDGAVHGWDCRACCRRRCRRRFVLGGGLGSAGWTQAALARLRDCESLLFCLGVLALLGFGLAVPALVPVSVVCVRRQEGWWWWWGSERRQARLAIIVWYQEANGHKRHRSSLSSHFQMHSNAFPNTQHRSHATHQSAPASNSCTTRASMV
jgi:hypothetical protein